MCLVTGDGSRGALGGLAGFALLVGVALAFRCAFALPFDFALNGAFGLAVAAIGGSVFVTALFVARRFAVVNIPAAALKVDGWSPHAPHDVGAMALDTSGHTAIGK